MTIPYAQIYDYLEMPERPISEDLRLNQKRLHRIIPSLASSMFKFFGCLDDLSHTCVKGEVESCVKEFLKMLRACGSVSAHQESLAEKVAGIRLFQQCRKIGLGHWMDEWSLLCLEAGVNRSREAVEIWLGVKLITLWWLLGSQDPVDMSIGFGQNTVIKKIAAFPESDRDSYEDLFESDLYS